MANTLTDVGKPTVNRPGSGISDSAFQALQHDRVVSQTRLGNVVAALDAITELAILDPLKRRRNCRPLDLASPFLRQRHSLNLHGVDPRQATDALLVERYRVTIRCRDAVLLVEFTEPSEQEIPKRGWIDRHVNAPSAPAPLPCEPFRSWCCPRSSDGSASDHRLPSAAGHFRSRRQRRE